MTQGGWNRIANEVDFNLEIDIQKLIDEVPFDAKILDFGCGYGRIANELILCGYKNVVGIDPSIKMIERGSLMYPEIFFSHVSVGRLPYEDESFDAVVACGVFTCVVSGNDRDEAMAEIHRVLKPSGVFHIADFCSENNREFEFDYGIRMCHRSPQELRDMLRTFDVISSQVIQAQTMSGKEALTFRAFARKSLN